MRVELDALPQCLDGGLGVILISETQPKMVMSLSVTRVESNGTTKLLFRLIGLIQSSPAQTGAEGGVDVFRIQVDGLLQKRQCLLVIMTVLIQGAQVIVGQRKSIITIDCFLVKAYGLL